MVFAVVALVFGLTPGPDVMLVIRHSAVAGVRAGMAASLGAVTGGMTWGVAAAVGLAAVIQHSPAVYEVIKLAGAVYLVFLGVRNIVRARMSARSSGDDDSAVDEPRSNMAAFRSGLITDLLNPKMGVLYLALLPQFIPAGADVLRWSFVLMSVEQVTAIASLAGYAVLAHAVGKLIKRPSVTTWLERFLGSVLIGLGLRIAFT